MSQIPASVFAAAREKQAQLRARLANEMAGAKQARLLADAADAQADATRKELDELAEWLTANAAPEARPETVTPKFGTPVIEALFGTPKASSATPGESRPWAVRRNAIKKVVLETALQVAQTRKWFQTEEVMSAIAAKNIVLDVLHPTTRASQVLTLDDRFEHVRGLGWRLKERTPVAAGVQVANQSREDADRKEES